jgi:hypothetical protein
VQMDAARTTYIIALAGNEAKHGGCSITIVSAGE